MGNHLRGCACVSPRIAHWAFGVNERKTIMQPAQLALSRGDRILLNQLHATMNRANSLFESLDRDVQRRVHEIQNPISSLPYCIRWGLRACEELIEKSTPSSVEEIWLTEAQLAKRLGIGPVNLKQLIKRKVLVPMVRQGTAYFGLQECGKALKRNGTGTRAARFSRRDS